MSHRNELPNIELPNFAHLTTFTVQFESRDKIWLLTLWIEAIFQNTFILRRPGVANFDDIIKIVPIFIKTIFKDSRNVKRIGNYGSKCNLYLYFLI